MLSKHAQSLTPSPTLAIDAGVKKMQENGIEVINLCLGEPDFDTPVYIQKSAVHAMRNGFTHYTPTAGIAELRKVVAEKFTSENNIHYAASQIIVGNGSKQLLYAAFQVLCDKGDEVIVPVPTWSTFVEQIKLAGGTPVLVPLDPPFRLTAKDVERKITKRSKILLLNTPSNPTGAMIEAAELKKIAQLVLQNNLYVIADEIYEKITYGMQHVSFASLDKKLVDRTITVNGFSKAYAMTGWRIGYAGGPKDVIGAMTALQSQTTSNVVSFIQKAGVTALSENQKSVRSMVTEFSNRRAFVISALATDLCLPFQEPDGAFYVFVDIRDVLSEKYPTSAAWCQGLLDAGHVAVAPGEAFLYPGYFRLSFAASLPELKKAMRQIKAFLNL